ncbi:hypothetical protein NOR_02904 [Metarhizium rileyi]|uniref:Uncharacterized protein n=1 Tax=Metarhizium rileyi (strain RCEF 4871) TaxID=1649241 RepID=A0A167G4P3_METRR|nr:hypothetical protein NOR_02904 [Metarhizium rileyi RCEF 4871]TWU79042.1 hypothetical protein ED733_008521 [Metarhizium rileyi]
MHTSKFLGLALALVTSTIANPVPQGGRNEHVEFEAREDASPGCMKTMPLIEAFTWGPVETIWTTTTTTTHSVDCGTCTAVTSNYLHFGPGPVIFFTKTTTVAEPSTSIVLACAEPTGAVHAPGSATTNGPVYNPAS